MRNLAVAGVLIVLLFAMVQWRYNYCIEQRAMELLSGNEWWATWPGVSRDMAHGRARLLAQGDCHMWPEISKGETR